MGPGEGQDPQATSLLIRRATFMPCIYNAYTQKLYSDLKWAISAINRRATKRALDGVFRLWMDLINPAK